jgi:hypothetical protein
MSGRRHLVQRSRNTQVASSPAPQSRQSNSTIAASELDTELPPYEPLECPLTASARLQLDRLKNTHDYGKYKKHIKASILAVTEAATLSNDRLYDRKARAQRQLDKRSRDGLENEELTQEEKEDAGYLKVLNKKVKGMTEDTEKALRELIDYDDELAMFTQRLEGVLENIGEAPASRSARGRRQRRQRGSDDEEGAEEGAEESEEEPQEDVPVIAPSDLYKKALQDYETEYRAQSMRARYDDPLSDLDHDANTSTDMTQTTIRTSKELFTTPSIPKRMHHQCLTQIPGSQKTTRTRTVMKAMQGRAMTKYKLHQPR